MALQFRRGTAADVASQSFVPELGEPVYLTDEQQLYVGDGVTQGGISVAGATDIQGLSSVDLVSEGIGSIASYDVSSNTVTISLSLSHDYYVGLEVIIAGSPVTALNGTHTISEIPSVSQFAFLLTTADVANTVTTGTVTPKVANGAVLQWNQTTSKWEDGVLELNDFSDVDLSTAPTSGQILSYNGTSFVPDDLEVVNDTTPQLGGDLDVNGNDIVSTSNGDIEIAPDGTGTTIVKGNATGGSGKIALNCEQNSHAVTIQGPAHSAAANYTLVLPNALGNNGDVLSTDASGGLSWAYNGCPHTTFLYTASAPSGVIANSQKVGQNHGTWTEITAANANGPSSATFDPNLTGVSFSSSTGEFSGFSQGRYLVTAELVFEFNNPTPAFGNSLLHYIYAHDPSNTWFYASGINEYQPLPYTSYGSAAYTATILLSMVAVCEDATSSNNIIEIQGDQNMSTTYYTKQVFIDFIKIGEI